MECIEEGIVARVQGGDAIIIATRADACAKCTAKDGCAAIGGAPTRTEVRATNDIGASPGDRVAVSLPGSSVIGAAGVLYFMPALALIAGALGGHHGGGALGLDVNLGAALGALLGLGASLGLVALIGRRLSRRASFIPRISQVLARGSVLPLDQLEEADRPD